MDFKTSDKIYKENSDFTCTITFLTSEEGGKDEEISGIYRPLFKIADHKQLTSADIQFEDQDKAFPGDTVSAKVRILWVSGYEGQLHNGQEFILREAKQTVATGVILEVLNEKLLKQ